MSLRQHAKHALQFARQMTEALIETFSTESEWLSQTHPKANHALWIVAHLGLADNYFVTKFRPELDDKPEGWEELFWFESELQEDSSVYPSSAEVVAYARERRQTLYRVLEELTDDELFSPAPPADDSSPIAGAPCMGHLFHFAAYHEGVHTGQMTVCHRGLGNPPLFGSKKTETTEAQ